jgi:Ran GTPase-activating protein (RanGAP) involved in mRNA processing and transport
VHLNLSNNNIGYDGSRYIAQALKINKTLETLNLKLNTLNDKAGSKLFKDLAFNTKLKRLDLEANSFSGLVLLV